MKSLYASLSLAGAVLCVPGLTKDNPGVLMDVSFDQNGDPDRESFMTRVENGKQAVFAVPPPNSAK